MDASGDWTNENGPWNSALKIHLAGYLDNNDGSLSARGYTGIYWSSSQNGNNFGWDLFFNNVNCGMFADYKASSCSIRCLKD